MASLPVHCRNMAAVVIAVVFCRVGLQARSVAGDVRRFGSVYPLHVVLFAILQSSDWDALDFVLFCEKLVSLFLALDSRESFQATLQSLPPLSPQLHPISLPILIPAPTATLQRVPNRPINLPLALTPPLQPLLRRIGLYRNHRDKPFHDNLQIVVPVFPLALLGGV